MQSEEGKGPRAGPGAGAESEVLGFFPEQTKRKARIFFSASLFALDLQEELEIFPRAITLRASAFSSRQTLTLCAGRERDTREADATADIVAGRSARRENGRAVKGRERG